jgi:hypothetical protein
MSSCDHPPSRGRWPVGFFSATGFATPSTRCIRADRAAIPPGRTQASPFFPSAHGSNTPSWPAPIPPYGRIVRRFSPHRTLRLAIALPLTSVTKGSRRPLVPQQNLIRMRCRQLFFFLRHTSPPLPPPLLPPFFVLFSCPEWACTGFVSLHSLPADPSCLAKGPRRSQSGRECPRPG